jgi:hypothetical protein
MIEFSIPSLILPFFFLNKPVCHENGHKCHLAQKTAAQIYKILVRKPERKRPLLRHWCMQDSNVRMDLREMKWEGVDWICLAQDRYQWQALVNMVMNLWVP